ncbi:MAG: glycoside hydrolase family 13 protein [Chloroflexota bacterium]|nr:glycoside hydrolase family 13 protein [Chloroflexota bacterium]
MSIDTPDWVRDAVFYQIFPDRFASSERVPKPGAMEPWDAPPTYHGFKGGDLLGIVERLPYLQDLGITALYLTPIFASASNHRYHAYDYMHVDPLLGGDAAFRELLDSCHERDMKVVIDGVFNHSGRGFWPFHHVLEAGAASPYRGWFYFDEVALEAGRRVHAYPTEDEERRMGEVHSDVPRGQRSERALGYQAWWDLPALPKLNTGHPGMRAHLFEAIEHWAHFGVDGWRLDVPEEVEEGFWREFRQRVRAIDPESYIVAEIWREKPWWLQGDHFDALMNYPLTEALLGYLGGQHLDWSVVSTQHEYREFVRPMDGPAFARALEHVVTMYAPEVVAVMLNLLGSHDTARFVTLCGGDRASLRLATLVQMTLPGAPCIYYGDEVGVEGRHDPDCRRAFPWQEDGWDTGLRDFIRGAVALRHAHPVLRHGEFRSLGAEGPAMAYLRFDANDAWLVALNPGEEEAALVLDGAAMAGLEHASVETVGWEGWPTGAAGSVETVDEGGLRLRLPRRGALVARLLPIGSPHG